MLQPAKTKTEPKVRTEYLPGRVVVTGLPDPDSAVMADCPDLPIDRITDVDLSGQTILAIAIDWAAVHHNCRGQYDTLRGWLLGVIAAQRALQTSLDGDAGPETAETAPQPPEIADTAPDNG